MKNRRLLAAVLVMTVVMSFLSACGSSAPKETAAAETTAAETTPTKAARVVSTVNNTANGMSVPAISRPQSNKGKVMTIGLIQLRNRGNTAARKPRTIEGIIASM